MSRDDMLVICRVALHSAWARLEMIYGNIGEPPALEMNGRIWRTAGRAWVEAEYNKIDLSAKLFPHHQLAFVREIIPHEAAHIVAYRLFGDAGHGSAWKSVMRKYGLEPKIYHSLEVPE